MKPEPSRSFQNASTVLGALQDLLGDRLVTTAAIREQHSHGVVLMTPGVPDAVAFPTSEAEVSSILKICNAARVPVVPFGAGSSAEGQVAAVFGGISIDLSRMTRIIDISEELMDCRVEAGVTREVLNSDLRASGLFFPIDPGANATIGGMASTRASGTTAVRYGTMREAVIGLTVVTPDGRIVTTGGRARKSASGFDLTKLYVGSEGTLGVITQVQLRLHGIPETIMAAVCQFPDFASAVQAVADAQHSAIPLARVELMDEVAMRACISYSHLEDLVETPTLFLEFHGRTAAVQDEVDAMREIAQQNGCLSFEFAEKTEDRNKLWKARHNIYFATLQLSPGREMTTTDACLPISRFSECIMETRKDVKATGLTALMLGHVGDGNFHVNILYQRGTDEETAAAALYERIHLRSIRMGGTCSGEHGVGLHKMALLEIEHGEATDLMRDIKRALDPEGIMNPGKMLLPVREAPAGH